MILSTYLEKWNQIPSLVKQFLARGLILFIIWKIIYLGFLVPGRILDKPLTTTVGILTAQGLNLATNSKDYRSKTEFGPVLDADTKGKGEMQQSVYFKNYKLVGIYDGCNALELFVLYAGFIVCMPATLKRKIIFISVGTALIFIINILRCMGVSYVVQYHPKQANFVHHYVFVFVVYGLIIALWLLFVNKLKIDNNVE